VARAREPFLVVAGTAAFGLKIGFFAARVNNSEKVAALQELANHGAINLRTFNARFKRLRQPAAAFFYFYLQFVLLKIVKSVIIAVLKDLTISIFFPEDVLINSFLMGFFKPEFKIKHYSLFLFLLLKFFYLVI
jgi:hypothetical protein